MFFVQEGPLGRASKKEEKKKLKTMMQSMFLKMGKPSPPPQKKIKCPLFVFT